MLTQQLCIINNFESSSPSLSHSLILSLSLSLENLPYYRHQTGAENSDFSMKLLQHFHDAYSLTSLFLSLTFPYFLSSSYSTLPLFLFIHIISFLSTTFLFTRFPCFVLVSRFYICATGLFIVSFLHGLYIEKKLLSQDLKKKQNYSGHK